MRANNAMTETNKTTTVVLLLAQLKTVRIILFEFLLLSAFFI
jgi:hypothetical protein